MPPRALSAAFALAALLAGCKGAEGRSGSGYPEARRLFDEACAGAEEGVYDCYADERVERAEALLREVPEEAEDFAQVLDLLRTIAQGRKALREAQAEEEAAREEEADAAAIEASAPPAPPPPPPEVPPPPPQIETLRQFQDHYGPCVEKRMPFRETGPAGKSGEAWAVRAGLEDACSERFPEIVGGQLYLFAEGRLHRIAQPSEGRVVEETKKVDAGTETPVTDVPAGQPRGEAVAEGSRAAAEAATE